MSDGEIQKAWEKDEIIIDPFSSKCLEPASYDMRLGRRILISSQEGQIDLKRQNGDIIINPGDFGLLTTLENIKLSRAIAGSIGLKSFYARKGLILLAGPQIDPGFEGVLVLGVYNASSKKMNLRYSEPFCTVEFQRLAQETERAPREIAEQKIGEIPKEDKFYLTNLETKSVTQLSINVSTLDERVSTLDGSVSKLDESVSPLGERLSKLDKSVSNLKVTYAIMLSLLLVILGAIITKALNIS